MNEEITKLVSYIEYILRITSGDIIEIKGLKSNEKEYSPFIEFKEKDNWESLESLPDNLLLIKTVSFTVVKDEEETVVTYEYFYKFYEKEETVIVKEKSVCSNCKFYQSGENSFFRRFRKDICINPNNSIHDYIRDILIPGDCRRFNSYGECLSFSQKEEVVEDNTLNNDTVIDEETSENQTDEVTKESVET